MQMKWFKGVTRVNKEQGPSEINSLPLIDPQDLKTLAAYVENHMNGLSNSHLLQDIVLFNIMYYLGKKRVRKPQMNAENTFAVDQDLDGCQYIHLDIKEKDKNHKDSDMSPNNAAWIYEIPRNLSQIILNIIYNHFLFQQTKPNYFYF